MLDAKFVLPAGMAVPEYWRSKDVRASPNIASTLPLARETRECCPRLIKLVDEEVLFPQSEGSAFHAVRHTGWPSKARFQRQSVILSRCLVQRLLHVLRIFQSHPHDVLSCNACLLASCRLAWDEERVSIPGLVSSNDHVGSFLVKVPQGDHLLVPGPSGN